MTTAKAKIRKGTLLNRKMLSQEEWHLRVQKVQAHLISFVQSNQIKCCHLFLPITKNKEFDTWDLLKELHNQDVEIQLSVSNFEDFTMTHFVYRPDVKFVTSSFGIPEPAGALPADTSKLDLVLIPLQAADKKGNRIGYGRGFYDRLLGDLPSNILKVGVSLAPLFDEFPFAESHDINLDFCATPHEIIKCSE